MSLGTTDIASETGDDSLSAITFESDIESKTKRKSFHKPPSTSPKSPYYSKPRKVTSWRSLKTAGSMPLSSRMSLTPQKLWLGSSKQGHVSGTSVYREKEDMYDEIIELKKSLHMQKSDVDLMRTKLRRLEEENSRKDRQIEQLLDPSRGPDFVRTLAEKKPDTGWVITGLKQRIFRLEQQCKEKDNTINKLQTDMKTTNLEEMRIAMETYYEEIHRLQTLLASSEATGKKPMVEKKLGVKRQKKMSSALLNLTRSVQELTEENQSLKEDLDRMLSNSPTISKIKGYGDWSKPRLLRRIAELEKKVSSSESPKQSTSELVNPNPLVRSPSNISVQKQPKGDQSPEDLPKVAPCEEQEHLQGTVKSLREELGALQEQLLEKDLEMKQLLQSKIDLEKELETAREGEKGRQEQEQALREEVEALTKKCQELEEAKREEKNSFVAVTHEKREAALDEAATVLQAAFRGHLARSKLVRSKVPDSRSPSLPGLLSPLNQSSPAPRVLSPISPAEENPTQEEAVIVIQSILRGYLAQARFIASCCREIAASSQRETVSLTPSGSASPPSLRASPEWGPSGKNSEASSGEAAKDEDEAEEPPDLQPYSGVIRKELCASEELRETSASEPAPSVPYSAQGGHGDCPSSSSLEAVPSMKDAMCEERSSSPRSAGPSLAEPSPPELQPLSPPPVEDICSDDSDDIIFSPFLPRKKSPSPF
ncbi:IQ domain-containing protein E isoform X10 [Mus musculus]|uniref:IQ domain-containing protein E isoform X10 n=1 Tax=Mus musculus TaxID=10090 RepID=UPI00167B3DDE|nr:IQ domain-containing protein E isoform X10 [Mus musculus]